MQLEVAVISTISSIITGIVASYVTYYFTVKTKRTEAILKFKEEKYSRLIVLLQGFVGQTTSAKTKRDFFEEQYRSWLYCSDEVVIAINKMVELIIKSKGAPPNAIAGKQAIGNIVLAMRKDLGEKTKLKNTDFTYTDVLE